jgi:DNA-binding response OmpR family regulator
MAGPGSITAPVLCYGPPEELSAAWDAGCEDYLKEPWTLHELHFRIERILGTTGGVAVIGPVEVRETEMLCGGNRDDLTAQEGKILSLLLRNPGSAVPREALYYAIWGRTGGRSRVADMHISKLRKKLARLQKEIPTGQRVEIASVSREGYAIR